MEITIDGIETKKEMINICRQRINGSLEIIDKKKMNVLYDFVNGTTTCTFNRKSYPVSGTIYMHYIVVA